MNSRHLFLGLSIATLALVIWSKDFILFWDTVQFTGKHGLWYYKEGIGSGLLPGHLDSGHPPFFGIYQAIAWKTFACSPMVSSFSMLPFLLLNIYFTIKIGELRLKRNAWLYPIAVFVCPFYLGHSILISPDLILITGFLMTWYGLMSYKRTYLYLGSLVLCLISMRGAIVCFAFICYHAYFLHKSSEQPKIILRKLTIIYLPAIIAFIGFQVIHYFHSSWIGFHEDSPWSTSFQFIDLSQYGKNLVVFVWRMLDYGMIVPYVILGYFLVFKKRRSTSLVLLAILLLVFAPMLLPFSGLLNHRYFLPMQLVAILIALEFVEENRGYALGMIVLLFLGNLIIYPDRISQGWDSTAAHWPFYKLEKEMYQYISDSETLSVEKVGTAFPFRVQRNFLDLGLLEKGYHEYDLSLDEHILYSNIMNEFSDTDISTLQSSWIVIKELERGGIKFVLYSKK